MRKNNLYVTLILVIATSVRLSFISTIPKGVSLFEIRVGHVLGTNNILLIRLPFVLLSLLSIYLVYKVCFRYFKDDKVSLLASAVTAFTPWHIQFSRIGNLEMVLFTAFLLVFYYFYKYKIKNISKIFIIISLFLLIISVLIIDPSTANKVNNDRHLISSQTTGIVPHLFLNKFTENFQLRLDQFYEKLDFGYYFFKGQPKPRWGSEEIQRFLIVQLPLLFIGLYFLEKKYKAFLLSMFVSIITVSVFFNGQNFDIEFLLIFPASYLTATVINNLIAKKNMLIYIIFLPLFVFEVVSFIDSYMKGYEESIFSGRRPYLESLVKKVELLDSNNILITDRIENVKKYFDFYYPNNNYTYTSYKISEEQFKYDYYVGVIPDNPSPSEDLYAKEGWPDLIEVKDTIYDPTQRQTNIIFKYVGKK